MVCRSNDRRSSSHAYFYIWMNDNLGTHHRASVCTHFVVGIIVYICFHYYYYYPASIVCMIAWGQMSDAVDSIHRTPNSHKTFFSLLLSVDSFSWILYLRSSFIYRFMLDLMVAWPNANRMPCASQPHRSVHMPTMWVHGFRFEVNRSNCVRWQSVEHSTKQHDRMKEEIERERATEGKKMLQNNLNIYTRLS